MSAAPQFEQRIQALTDRALLRARRVQSVPEGSGGAWFDTMRRRVIGGFVCGWDRALEPWQLEHVPEAERVFITREDFERECDEDDHEIRDLLGYEEHAGADEMLVEQLDHASRFARRHVETRAPATANAPLGIVRTEPLRTVGRMRSARRRRTARVSRGSPSGSDPDEPEPPLGRAA